MVRINIWLSPSSNSNSISSSWFMNSTGIVETLFWGVFLITLRFRAYSGVRSSLFRVFMRYLDSVGRHSVCKFLDCDLLSQNQPIFDYAIVETKFCDTNVSSFQSHRPTRTKTTLQRRRGSTVIIYKTSTTPSKTPIPSGIGYFLGQICERNRKTFGNTSYGIW